MVPIVIVLICVGWRLLLRWKKEHNDDDMMDIKTRAIDPDESVRINSDDESIPYKKDLSEESPEPTEGVKIVDSPELPVGLPYQYPPPPPALPQAAAGSARQWGGETEIN